MEMAKTRTSPYRPSSNSHIERQNRTILQIIRCIIKGNITNWDKDLALALMHSTEQKSTGFTPNQVMLGRGTIQPGELVLGTVDLNISPTDPASWVSNLRNTLDKIHHEVRKNLNSKQLAQKFRYDIKVFHEGDLVYRQEKSTKKGKVKK